MKKKAPSNRNLVAGILLAVFASLLLAAVGFWLFQKYSQADSLAEMLPAEDTLFFAELRLDERATQLTKIFENEAGTEILGFDSLGFSDFGSLLTLAENRIGLAFFGEKIDPQNFALVLDLADENAAIDFFESETLPEESLATQNFLHQKIFYFPQSRSLAFTFFDGNLILAANVEILQKIATAIHVPEKRVAKSAGFRAVAAKLNPRGNFVYATPKFLDEFFVNRFNGIQKALAAPLVNLWLAGGATFEPTTTGLRIQAQLILKKSAISNQPFLAVDNLDKKLLKLWGQETKFFSANESLAHQIENFLANGGSQNSTFSTIADSLAKNLIHTWLGENFGIADFVELLESPSAIGLTNSGGLVLISEESLQSIFEKLKRADGKIAAREKIIALPDTTPGHELTIEQASKLEEGMFAGEKITTLHFPQYNLSFAQLEDFSIISTEKEALEKMVARAVGEEEFLPELSPASGNVVFMRVDTAANPFLKPFQFVLADVNFESDSVRIDFSLEQ